MNWETLQNLGVGVSSVGGLVFITQLFVKAFQRHEDKYMSAIDSREKAYREYVESHNHSMTELVIKVNENIQASTTVMGRYDESLGKHIELLQGIKEHFKKE